MDARKKNRGEGEPPSPLARAGADLLLAFFLLARRRGAPRGPWWARKGARNGRPPSQAPALGSGGRPRGGAGARGAHAKGAPSEVPRALLTLGACSLHSALPSPPSHPPQSAPHTAPGAGQVDHQDGWAGSGWAWRAEAHRGRPLGPPSRGPSFFFPTSVCARPSQPSNFPSPPRAPRAAFIPSLPPQAPAPSLRRTHRQEALAGRGDLLGLWRGGEANLVGRECFFPCGAALGWLGCCSSSDSPRAPASVPTSSFRLARSRTKNRHSTRQCALRGDPPPLPRPPSLRLYSPSRSARRGKASAT